MTSEVRAEFLREICREGEGVTGSEGCCCLIGFVVVIFFLSTDPPSFHVYHPDLYFNVHRPNNECNSSPILNQRSVEQRPVWIYDAQNFIKFHFPDMTLKTQSDRQFINKCSHTATLLTVYHRLDSE